MELRKIQCGLFQVCLFIDGLLLTVLIAYCEGGSLKSYLETHNDISVTTRLGFLKGIAGGMLHMHAEDVVHRDLAARNVLLTETNQVQLCDFGLSRTLTSSDAVATTIGNSY
jgi:serine/threonine protein kinase